MACVSIAARHHWLVENCGKREYRKGDSRQRRCSVNTSLSPCCVSDSRLADRGCSGYIDTPALRAAGVKGDNLDLGPRFKRMGTAEEVASVVAFLLGDESKYVTGSTYTIDGGITA